MRLKSNWILSADFLHLILFNALHNVTITLNGPLVQIKQILLCRSGIDYSSLHIYCDQFYY